jgi:hypothetical protein
MRVQEERVFRIPIDDLRAALKSAHGLDLTGVEPYIDGDSVVFAIKIERPIPTPKTESVTKNAKVTVEPAATRVRRRRRRRNRVKTRGWRVVGKIRNSTGLLANVYEPFVDIAKNTSLPKSELRKLARQVMVRNGNNPSEESIDYFLNNALEYLARPGQSS